MDSKYEAASTYVEAAKVCAKTQPQQSTDLLKKAVSLYTEMGRLNMAARQLKDIAEVNEKQGDKEEAMSFYAEAADLFETENSTSEATKCRWGGWGKAGRGLTSTWVLGMPYMQPSSFACTPCMLATALAVLLRGLTLLMTLKKELAFVRWKAHAAC